MEATIIRLAGYTAHFRDPRTNTAKIGLPSRTLRCPPPCTIHGLLCAAHGGWVEPSGLYIGWRMEYLNLGIDFQTSILPQRSDNGLQSGTKVSPIEREFLTFPILSLLLVDGVNPEIFRSPINPLSLGRSEDLIVEKSIKRVVVHQCNEAELSCQCLPVNIGSGTIYSAPLYFVNNRQPVNMLPRVDAAQRQVIASSRLLQVDNTHESFYMWNFYAS